MRFILIGTTLLLLMAQIAMAGDVQVDEVLLRGTQRVDRAAVAAAVTAQPGTVTEKAVEKDIRAIFALGQFSDVRAEFNEEEGKKILTYLVVERPLVRRIKFEGNEELEDSKLRPLLAIKTPSIYDPGKTREGIEAIRKAYVEEGYYAAEIVPELDNNDRNEATLLFKIEEGAKVLVDEIFIEGNTVLDEDDLKDIMQTKERWFLSWLTDRGTFQQEVLDTDVEIIKDAYFNQGYVRVDVKEPLVTLSDDRESLNIFIEISEGEQFRTGEVDLKGEYEGDKAELLTMTKLKEGDIFSREQLRESVFALNDHFGDLGYAYVNVAPLTRIDPEEKIVHLAYEVEQGVKVYVNHIRINGNTKTRDKVIRREMKLAEGDLYSISQIKRSRQRVNNLGFFEEVDVTQEKLDDPGLIDLDVKVKEGPTGTFSAGAGYSSVDGVIGQLSVEEKNFLGRGMTLSVSGAFSKDSTTYNLGLTEPYFLDTNMTLGGDIYNTEREYDEYSKKALGGDVKIGFPTGEYSKAYFIYRYEQKEIYDVDDDASLTIRSQEGDSVLSSIYGSWTYDKTDFRLDPSSGYVGMVSAEFAGIGGTENFAKYITDYRHFWPLFWGTVFSVHGQAGYVQEVNGEPIPIDERFYLGGIRTLRGFESRSVGPRIATDSISVDPISGETITTTDYEKIGGVKQAFTNLEFTFPLVEEAKLKGLLFFDMGNAWGEDEDMFSSARRSAGFGIRWMSPMGPLRLEWGWNLDQRDDEDKMRFEFTIGRFY